MKKLLTILSLLCINAFLSSFNLSWVHPLPQGNTLNSTCINENTIFAVGEYGTIIKSNDNGASWSFDNQFNGIESDFNDIDFCDADIGFIVGDGGTVLKTENNGISWYSINSGLSVNINCIEIINQALIFIGTNQGLYKTSDLGESWEYVNFTGNIRSIDFPSEQIGYLCGYATVYKSTDSGLNWTLIYTLSDADENEIYDLCFFDDDTGIFVGECVDDPYGSMPDEYGVAYKTYNGGFSWESKISWGLPLISISYHSNYVYCCGNRGIYGNTIKSVDYGENWSEISTEYYCSKSITLINNSAIAVGIKGIILEQELNENFWNVIGENLQTSFSNLQFVNEDFGYISTHSCEILKSVDSGNSWELVNSDTPIEFFFFIDEAMGFGYNEDEIYKTTDGGLNWQLSYSQQNDNYLDIFLLNSDVGFVGGWSGDDVFILKTTDGGLNWQRYVLDELSFIRDIYFIDENVGFISDINAILMTENGGNNWSVSHNAYLGTCGELFFPSSQIGYCAGQYDVYKTEDNGDTWFSLGSPLSDISSIFFVTEDIGFVTGYWNQFQKTLDGGITWEIFDFLYPLMGLGTQSYFFDENHGIIAGGNCIFSYTDETGAADNIIKMNAFQLTNYPNPFNPTTTISFSLNSETCENTELVIYNLKGQKVKVFTFPNGSFGTSEQNVVWDGTDNSNKPVSSGIYFYRLKAGDFNQTRKMLLMK